MILNPVIETVDKMVARDGPDRQAAGAASKEDTTC